MSNIAVIVLDDNVPDEAIDKFVDSLHGGMKTAIQLLCARESGALADSISVAQNGPRIIRIMSSLPYAGAVDKGTSPRLMWNLINRVVPLRINGTTVFRKVTLKALTRGKWRHPGTPGKHFVERGAALAAQQAGIPSKYRVIRPAVTVVNV